MQNKRNNKKDTGWGSNAIYQNAPEAEASQVQGLPELYTKFNEGQDILLLACARYNK